MNNEYATELNLPLQFSFEDIPGLHQEKVDLFKYEPSDIDQSIHTWLRDNVNARIHWCEILILPPWKSYKIHIDGELYDREDKGKLNFIAGGTGSKMIWFEDTDKMLVDVTPSGTNRIISRVTPKELFSCHVEGFVLASVGILHTVRNLSEPRYCLTTSLTDCTTNQRLTYSELQNRFEGYIK